MPYLLIFINALLAVSLIFIVTVYRKFHATVTPKEGYLKTFPVSTPMRIMNATSETLENTIGYTPFNIRKKSIIKLAKEIASKTDRQIFGDQDEFVKAVSLFVNGIDEQEYSASGSLLLGGFLTNTLRSRKLVIDYIQNHPEVLQGKFEDPVIISGLPRTGSTLLYNLMACDPGSRSPFFYEMSPCVPIMPPVKTEEESKNHPRIRQVLKRFELIEKFFPNYFSEANKSHYAHPSEIEEDILVMYQSFVFHTHWFLSDPAYREWYDNENKDSAYQYHHRFFQLLSYYWSPKSHWLLKAPVHATYLHSLHKQYPNARLIFTHRDPTDIVPSWVRLNETYNNWNFKDYTLDRRALGKKLLDSLALCSKRLIDFTSSIDSNPEMENNKVYININYSDLMKDPIATVEKIYKFFDIPFTDQFKINMDQYLKENQQGKHGRREYSLDDYHLSRKQIQDCFDEYVKHFDVPLK